MMIINASIHASEEMFAMAIENRAESAKHSGRALQQQRATLKLEFHGTDTDTDTHFRDAPIV